MSRISTTLRSLQCAFTLVEMLVVLIIVGLVSGILLQAVEQVFRLQRRFGVEVAVSQQGAMLSDWFRQTIEGLFPDYPDGKHKFSGTERRLSGLTTNSLTTEYGVPTVITWELAFDPDSGRTRLLNGTGKDAAPLMSWQGNQGRFVYLDAKGEAHDSWPPRLGDWPQLPAAIRLEGLREGEPLILVAVPMGPKNTLPRLKDIKDVLGVAR